MADKKDDKKKEEKPSNSPAEQTFIILFGIILVVAALYKIIPYFYSSNSSVSTIEMLTGGANGWFANLLHFIKVLVTFYVTVATIYSIVLFLIIVYVAWLIYRLSVEEKRKDKLVAKPEKKLSMQAQKWEQILKHVNSDNAAEWRLSILEADVLLDDMLQEKGFMGETIGERLQKISKGDFKTLDEAWEAHKIRNAIAHEGSSFLLSQRESKRVIGLYEIVFKEFNYV